jgi:hypothetical protein
MSKEEFNPFPDAKITNKKTKSIARGSSAPSLGSSSSSVVITRGRSLVKGLSKSRKGLSSTTPSGSKRARGGGRY